MGRCAIAVDTDALLCSAPRLGGGDGVCPRPGVGDGGMCGNASGSGAECGM